MFKRILSVFLPLAILFSLSGCQPAISVRTTSDRNLPSVMPLPSNDPDSRFEEGFCPLPTSKEELRRTAVSLKRYEESYLQPRSVEEVVCYVGKTCAIYIRKVSFGLLLSKKTAYVADLYLKDASQLLGCVLRDETGKLSSGAPEDVIRDLDVLFLVNGDYLSIRKWGLYVRNGQRIRDHGVEGIDVCLIGKDGKMRVENGDTFDTAACLSDPNLWHVISFGPSLLNEDGSARNEDSEFHITDKYSRWNQYDSSVGFPVPNPRTAMGQAADGHYIFAAVDGRQKGYSDGMTFPQLSHLMYEEGAEIAYNLDGGGSVYMYFNGEAVNRNSGGRAPSDYFCILNEKDS